MNKIRVMIADDERPAREYLRSLLADMDNVEIIGEAENGADALALCFEMPRDFPVEGVEPGPQFRPQLGEVVGHGASPALCLRLPRSSHPSFQPMT